MKMLKVKIRVLAGWNCHFHGNKLWGIAWAWEEPKTSCPMYLLGVRVGHQSIGVCGLD